MSCNCHYAPLLLFTWICVWSVVLVHGSPVLVVDEDTNQTTAEGHHGVTSNDHEEVIDEDRAHRLIDIYVQMQKRTERKENVPHTKEEEKFVDYFFEDDIMLTVAQAQAVLQGLSRRQKRKLARPLVKRWQLPIPFTFDGRHS
ncbi:hypothetical protein CAPTEDRAFT_212790 [Capitella teleta]|uniref:Uncharacterized protein n=1 Tax=Capitella teleta TaxID=283909 RepID=R7TGG9_CAPTE|nr:hypothetical protein CAPTEDRAFT_212790 [Capitella teleta]|eukprot:ELT90666.1 hypothetical protein CAPTEDRAFT_212790 [Capitella teleta]